MSLVEIILAYLFAGVVSAAAYIAACVRQNLQIHTSTICYLIIGWLPLAVLVLIVWLGTMNEKDEI
jgi:hypothetical protein